MAEWQIVIDTNVLVAALRSRRGASYRLLQMLGSGRFDLHVSVPLVLEYEAVARRLIVRIPLTGAEIDDVIDYLCQIASHWKIYYLWRPRLRDPKDDLVLELAVTAGCDYIVTFNRRDFPEAARFGIQAGTPREFLQKIGELP